MKPIDVSKMCNDDGICKNCKLNGYSKLESTALWICNKGRNNDWDMIGDAPCTMRDFAICQYNRDYKGGTIDR